MLCLSVLVAVGMTGLCLGSSLPEPPHNHPHCPLQHSCSFRNASHDSVPGCSCDASCRTYGDCCRDSPHYKKDQQVNALKKYKCVAFGKPGEDNDYVYVRGKCLEDWDNGTVLMLCLIGNTLAYPTKRLPVTSTTTGLTYVNHFCAICNGEDPSYLRMWNVKVEFDGLSRNISTEDYAVVFHDKMFGVIVPLLGTSSFTPRSSTFITMPQDIRNFTTPCVPTVTTCPHPGEEKQLTLCQSYAAPVYAGNTGFRFRNQHCASCTGYNESTCEAPVRTNDLADDTSSNSYSGVKAQLTMILDFTGRSGSNGELARPCGPEEVWDNNLRKCRKIICPNPSEKFSYDKCVPVEDDATRKTGKQELLCPFHHFCSVRYHAGGCSCNPTCRIYGDCCRDSEHYDEAQQKKNVNEYMCVEFNGYRIYKYVYMRGKCLEGWDNTKAQGLCVKGNTLPDPTKSLPVTNTTTGRTYVNHYCAICNGEDPTYLRVWEVGVKCNDLPSNASKNEFAVVHLDTTWGLILPRIGLSSFTPCSSYATLPLDGLPLTTPCVPMVTTCSDPRSNEHERSLCQSYSAPVYHGDVIYRNQHCASCNGYTDYMCGTKDYYGGRPDIISGDGDVGVQLTMLLDFTDHTGSNLVGLSGRCDREEVWDKMSEMCRKIICPQPGEKFLYGRCVPVQGDTPGSPETHTTVSTTATSAIYTSLTTKKTLEVRYLHVSGPSLIMSTADSSTENTTAPSPSKTNSPHQLPTSAPTTAVPVSQDSQDRLSLPLNATQSYDDCLKVLLSEAEFTRHTNGSVYVPAHERTYQAGEYETGEGGVLVCWPADSWHKFSQTLGWVNLVGLSFSCLALVLHLTAFCLVPSLRNLSGQCLASLCLSLLAAYTTLLLNMMDPPSQAGCTALAAAMYYFFLCSFAWMTAIAFDVWYTFYLTQRELRVAGGSQSHRFLAYSLCSWLLPAVSMVVLVTVDQLEPQGVSQDFLPRLGQGWCWFSHRKSLLVFFATPMAALTLMNVVFFACTAALIAKMARSAATPTAAPAGRQRPKRYWTFLRLAVLMGLTWTTGILAGCLDLAALWYIFVVLNSLQGVFIFLAFTCRTKVLQAVGSRGHRLLQWAVSVATRRSLQPDPSLETQQ